MRKLTLSKTLLLALGLGCSLSVSARERLDAAANKGGSTGGNGNKVAAGCLTSSSSSSLDINNVRVMVLNGGDMWWNLFDPRYEVPKVTDPNLPKRHAIFAGAVWIGGKDAQDNLYTATQTYRQFTPPEQGYWPGPLNSNGDIDKADCDNWNYHAKIDKAMVDKFREDVRNGLVNQSTNPDDLPKAIREWPGRKNPHLRYNTNYELAPFVNVGGPVDEYNPLDGDYPDFRGDQSIWWVMNDAGNVKTPLSKKIGMEVQVLAFAFQTNDLINNMTFYKQILKNKGTNELRETYIGQWVDPDLGFYNDDFVGCDVARGLGICYNGDNDDEGVNGYGLNPPAVGVDFFQGPKADPNDGIDNDRDGVIDEPNETIIMSSFIYFNNDGSATNGNPSKDKASDYYNYLRAVWKDGKNITYGGDGTNQSMPSYKFMFPGDTDPSGYGFSNPPAGNPITPWNWTENQPLDPALGGQPNTPADRRFLQSAGPFTLKPGSVNELTIGVVWARANSGGATGSLNLLKYADDKAQKLFDNDFQLPSGPDAPELAVTEMDQQLILTLKPSEFTTSNNDRVTTETYFEADRSLSSNKAIKDPFYRFEGYKIYQLKDLTVTASELENRDRARLVAQADIKNGVANIVNREFDADVEQTVPRVRVKGSDKGVFHTLNVTTDLFATGNDRIVNFKTYHYMVVAYAYNGDPANTDDKYLEGRKVSVASGIPHKTEVENGGTLLTAAYGTNADVTRIMGTGNGGHVLEITPQDEAEIVEKGSKAELHYRAGNAPFVVKVYDPKKVKGGEFQVKLASRLVYKKSSAQGADLKVGDEIVSTGNFTRPDQVTTVNPNKMTPFPQVPGRGIVRKIVSTQIRTVDNVTDTYYTIEVEMLNDHIGGTFVAFVDKYKVVGSGSNETTVSEGHGVETRPFRAVNSNFTAVANEFALNDYWMYKKSDEGDDKYVRADRPISDFNEQLLPEFGVAIEFTQANNPGFQVRFNPVNGYQESSIAFPNGGQRWFKGIGNVENTTTTAVNWLMKKSTNTSSNPELQDIDYNYAYLGMVEGWAPYAVTAKESTGAGAAYFGTNPTNRKLYDLQNVDVVITSDKSKWTRVPVVQGNASTGLSRLTKRGTNVFSVDKNGNEITEDSPYPKRAGAPKQRSVAMGWFPGYAIDLDRGIRLNMMFSEFGTTADPNNRADKGRDLIWEPTSDLLGGRNYIYVMKTPYDEAKALEYALDSAKYAITNNAQFQSYTQSSVFNNVLYVGFPRLEKGTTLLASDVRVRLRVNRAFTSYNPTGVYNIGPNNTPVAYNNVNTNPEYRFNTNALVPQIEQTNIAKSALDLIRVVPNPYYAYSQYEQRQLDNIVKFTNLPKKCKISIYTVNGTLVRTFNKDDSRTFLDWNLKNENNLPIASGVYIVNIDAGNIGSKVVKFFGIMRPMDLESF